MPTNEQHRVIVEVHGGLVTVVAVPDTLVLPVLVRDYDTEGAEEQDLYFDFGDIEGGEYLISEVSTVDAEREYEAELLLAVRSGVVEVVRQPSDVVVEIRDYDTDSVDEGELDTDSDGELMIRIVHE